MCAPLRNKCQKELKQIKIIVTREMKRETELVHDHLNLMHRFLTSFDMRDTCISETAKLSLSDIPSTELPGLSDLKEAKLHTNYPIFVLLKLKDEM